LLERFKGFNHPPTLVGVWDFSEAPFRLGNILLFNQSLHLIRNYTHAQMVEVVVICEPEGTFLNSRIDASNYRTSLSQLTNIFLLMDTITSFKIFTSRARFDDYLAVIKEKGFPYFPPGADSASEALDYKSHNMMNEFLDATGELCFAEIHQDAMNTAKNFLVDCGAGETSIAIHLRYDPSHRLESNAKLSAWENFLAESTTNHPDVRFIMVGNDDLPGAFIDRIKGFGNVVRTHDQGLSILDELPIIKASTAFMGMASGPCTAAVLGDKPYLVIKHPEDAWAEKFEELDGGERFPFANPQQQFKIIDESPAILTSFLDRILAAVPS
jgi:hypothetical protein